MATTESRDGAGSPRDRDRGRRLLEPDHLPALHARARARRGPDRRGRRARGRHGQAHRPLAEGQVRRPRARLRGPDLVGRRQRVDLGGALRGAAGEGRRRTSARKRPLRRRRVRRRRPETPDRRPRRHELSVPRALRPDDVHRPDRRGAARVRAAGTRPARPGLEADPDADGTRTGTFVVLHPSRQEVLIGGSFYAGEIKKSIFTLMNDRLPLEGVFPMHCSANVGETGDVAIFFGLSGTGKTTLSADPERSLIGDDEHGWGDDGVFNFEGGCYAKVINLSAEAEPEIFRMTQTFGTILENVVLDERGVVDLDDGSKTENTRAAYKLEQIANALPAKRAGPPAVGDLPDRRRVRDPAADRAADARPGDVLVPLRLHRQARRHGDRRQGAAADLLGLFRRALPAAAARGLRAPAREEARRARREGLAREHGLDGRPVRRGRADADPGDARSAARGDLRRAGRTSSTARTSCSASRCPSRCPTSTRACSTPARPGATRRRTTRRRDELAAMFRDNFTKFDADDNIVAGGPRLCASSPPSSALRPLGGRDWPFGPLSPWAHERRCAMRKRHMPAGGGPGGGG